MNWKKQFEEGLLSKNPVFVQLLGMCSTLAITTSLFNGLGMGVSVTIILICSNVLISALRKVIPNEIRIAAYIVIIAGFVTIVDLLLQAFLPDLANSLGVFIPLIVVNCIILGRAEAYASKNPPVLSIFDGLGMGLGFTLALTLIGLVRELLGNGTAFGFQVMPGFYQPIGIIVKAPGAFLILALVIAFMNSAKIQTKANDKVEGCDGCCATCAQAKGCTSSEKKEGVNV